MKKMPVLVLLTLILASCGSGLSVKQVVHDDRQGKIPVPAIPFSPRHYVCYRTVSPINIDGEITDSEWAGAPWSEKFTDIEGDLKPAPLYDSRIKLLWDDKYLYIAAELKEPDIWAKLKQRDTIIFYDNDFEVFIDPDGDTHGYYEFEMNALNTVWDLLLTTPYRDFGHVLDAWNINDLLSAVKIYGTLNNPSDTDDKWTIELAFPFDVLSEWGSMPQDGTQWRVNFSRVNWKVRDEGGQYVKETDPATGKSYPEFNWLWSPQGLINVHYPEMWGFLQFSSGDGINNMQDFIMNPDEAIKWELRRLYYAQRNFAAEKKRYAENIVQLISYGYEPEGEEPEILITLSGYEASLPGSTGNMLICINNKGRVWTTDTE